VVDLRPWDNSMTFQDNLKVRTKAIGLQTIKLVEELPNKPVAWMLTKQILRSSTSIGANYRAACHAKSTADFINKLKIVEEESDESVYWLEILEEAGLLSAARTTPLKAEIKEVIAIVVKSIKTTRERNLSR
jgi:four helix bundle protein